MARLAEQVNKGLEFLIFHSQKGPLAPLSKVSHVLVRASLNNMHYSILILVKSKVCLN
jgi:hypothetical protein